jgi:BlaI family penicillinase repressor
MSGMNKRYVSISESEWRVMKILWKKAPLTLNQVIDALSETEWTTTTIQTYLARLVKKGALSTKRQGKGYLYSPNITEEECQTAESENFLNRVFDGSVANMVSGFIKSGSITEKELSALKALIEEQEGTNGNK